MAERRRTKAQERSFSELVDDLHEMDRWLTQWKLREKHIPRDWHKMETIAPCTPRKARMTAAFDADMLRWYRSLGRGYQARMNAVLRSYMLAVISKEIEGRGDRDWKGDPI